MDCQGDRFLLHWACGSAQTASRVLNAVPREQVKISDKSQYDALMDRAAYDKYLEENAH